MNDKQPYNYAHGVDDFYTTSAPPRYVHFDAPFFDKNGCDEAQRSISSWSEYKPTSLRPMPHLAKHLGVASIEIKDESSRFGLGTFKALGGGYAVHMLAMRGSIKSGDTITCATDGNHGRGVAWAAQKHGLKSVIYIPDHVSSGREQYMKGLGAHIVRIKGSYEDALSECTRQTKINDWTLVSDTATKEDFEIPRLIMNSYSVVAKEVVNVITEKPTHIFTPVGVGGFSSSITEVFARHFPNDLPKIITVEPSSAACLHDSFHAGKMRLAKGNLETFMGCLACGLPATIPWTVLNHYAYGALAIKDIAAKESLKGLANGIWGDQSIETGESGVAAFSGLMCAASSAQLRSAFGITKSSRILVFMTEGSTDRTIFKDVVGRYPKMNYG